MFRAWPKRFMGSICGLTHTLAFLAKIQFYFSNFAYYKDAPQMPFQDHLNRSAISCNFKMLTMGLPDGV